MHPAKYAANGRPVPVKHAALIVGGGVAGMTAALSLAEQGFPVHLIEKEVALGGNLRHRALAHAYAPEVHGTCEHVGAGRPGVLGEDFQPAENALLDVARETFEIALGGFLQSDAIAWVRLLGLGQSPSSARTFSSETLPGSLSAFIAAFTADVARSGIRYSGMMTA